ncbi:MAG: hypothetical protein LKI94_02050 [Sporolactobacillus sp.]|nr:hypothetical protein [Sporolactobacillus sp.]MCI1880958.1 hypothetical protein [Sporolactobacillus sp.]
MKKSGPNHPQFRPTSIKLASNRFACLAVYLRKNYFSGNPSKRKRPMARRLNCLGKRRPYRLPDVPVPTIAA